MVDGMPDPGAQLGELGREAVFLGARVGQRDGDDRVDAARTGGHHDDPVGEEDRLVDVVGDEHDGAPVAAPGVEQGFLHPDPGQ